MNSRIISSVLAGIAGLMIAITAQAQLQSPLEAIHEGHWLEIHGQLLDGGTFEAQEVALIHSQRYEELTGTVAEGAKAGTVSLLGQEVELTDKTTFDRVARNKMVHSRVKVKGYYLGSKRFSARRVRPRGEGRDKLVGRVDQVRKSDEGLLVNLMGFSVRIAEDSPVMHQEPLANYELSDARTKVLSPAARDEDDFFGAGVRISDNLRMAGLIEGKWTGEDEFDLNKRRARDREDTEGRIRARFTYRPSASFIGVLELTYDQLWRDDDRDGHMAQGNTALAETFAYWMDPLQWDTDFQVGRMDFDDEREWLYDQNLDGARVLYFGGNLSAEFSVTTTLSDGGPRDENTVNSMLYVSNGSQDRHLAGYIIHRDTDLAVGENQTHVGLRAYGDWLSNHNSWLEISYMFGDTGSTDMAGWGLDLGTTWMAKSGLNFTLTYALGQGDKPDSEKDNSFHQTGLQDNNAKFAGVTSFKYYGELTNPELSNLEIITAGIGFRYNYQISVDLVGHYYEQNQLSQRFVGADIRKRPNGLDHELGWEADVVLGWRPNISWDLEVIAAYFKPGAAFDVADSAMLGKLQLRYRF